LFWIPSSLRYCKIILVGYKILIYMTDVSVLLNYVEASGIEDISSILNQATERFSNGEINLRQYKEILMSIAKRTDKLAKEIYQKQETDQNTRLIDIEEYRTLLDISRECRDGLRQIVLIRGYDDKIK